MPDRPISKLTSVSLRKAWEHEALDFTPWLSENIEYLSEALGLDLEIIGQEVAVDNYSADILAQDTLSGNRVLIENQLEKSDHTHLGQIMTYLSGLNAKTVIWIAPRFSDAHLSALKWLNEHTPEDFSFFAVTIRVVRIGNSPFAPVFEVQTKPDVWARKLTRQADNAEAEYSVLREAFWNRYAKRHPGKITPSRASNVWVPMVPDGSIIVSMWVAQVNTGLFVRRAGGAEREPMESFIDTNKDELEKRLGTEAGDGGRAGYFFIKSIDVPLRAKDRWDEAIEWLEDQRRQYASAISSVI